ncbi:MAG: hypothetical protein E7490_05840 [Ruminococcaceae bacterium]|nr:hypothetical protein [Oscillospiraceae bacterium]
MALNFGDWVVKVAINGVKAGSFGREWAALQLADYYARDKITEADITRFDEEMTAYEKQLEAEKALAESIMEMEGEVNE